jgi:hypothetical protein
MAATTAAEMIRGITIELAPGGPPQNQSRPNQTTNYRTINLQKAERPGWKLRRPAFKKI